jgi:glycosyltransferase involved in cell wall biosynthesis
MPHPLVSVCIPTHNRPRLLCEAVESVLGQSMPDFEILIVDDGSEQETQRVITDLLNRDSRIRAFRNSVPRGPSGAKNLALKEARGVYWTGLDDDDLFLPNRLSQLINAAQDRFAFTCTAFFVEKTKRRHIVNGRAQTITFDDLCYFNTVGNQAFTKVDYVRKLGGFDESMRTFEDYDLWLRLARAYGQGIRLAEATYVVRQGYTSKSLTFSTEFCEGSKTFSRKHAGSLSSHHKRSQRLVQAIACNEPMTVRLALQSVTTSNVVLCAKYALTKNKAARWLHDLLLTKRTD